MTRTASLHELAELELNDAADFYDSRQPDLGRSFVLAVQQAVLQIKKVLREFPYNVIYSLTPNTIRILAIAGQKRRPFYWRARK